MLPDDLRKAVEAMNLRFTSGNEIPVERAAIRAEILAGWLGEDRG